MCNGRWGGALLLSLALAACHGAPAAPRARVVPVKAERAVAETVPVQVTAIGTVTPIATVQVKSLVAGEIQRVFFKEGQYVAAGAPLFEIDPRPFELAVRQAGAQLARDQAQYENARSQADRYAVLIKRNMVSHQDFEQVRSQAAALAASVGADEAALKQARVNLGYTHITSPLEGRTGSLLVNAGNLVKANDVPLVTIRQIRPIYVAFSVPAERLPEIREYSARSGLEVRAEVAGPAGGVHSGRLSFIDNTIDIATGTVALKGTFANRDRALWPGQFVNVTLLLTERPGSVVLPAHAVETGQEGTYVFVVVGAKVVARPVTLGERLGETVVIDKGVAPGELVVTDGQLSLISGSLVRVQAVAAATRDGGTPDRHRDGGVELD